MNNKLKGYRVMAGFTQEDMSKYLEIDRTAYTYKENGSRRFSEMEKQLVFEKLKSVLSDLKMNDVFPVLEE